MRITNHILNRRVLDGLRGNLARLDEAQRQAVSGQLIESAADDPARYVSMVKSDRHMAAVDQYRRAIAATKAHLDVDAGVLDQIGDLLARARELAMSQAGANGNASTRSVAKAEVDEILGQVIALGNTRYGDGYLFGGDFMLDAPFAADGTTSADRPPSGTRQVRIGPGQTGELGHDALRVFVDSGVIESVRQLSAALGDDSPEGIAASVGDLAGAFDAVQDLLGEVGARSRQLETAGVNLDALETSLRTLRSDLGDVEMEEAISKLITRQTAYQAALMATSRMLSTTLTDYLR